MTRLLRSRIPRALLPEWRPEIRFLLEQLGATGLSRAGSSRHVSPGGLDWDYLLRAAAIAPRFGACLDFCSDQTSWLMPVLRVRVPVHRRFKVALGFSDDVGEVDFCEARVATLAEFLRRATRRGQSSGRARRRRAWPSPMARLPGASP
jgi:hypothetical protein